MSKKYWLKGIAVAVIIYVVLYCILLAVDDFGLALSIVSPGTWFIIGIDGVRAETKYAMQFVASAVIWAAVGALVGWIYGKIKKS